MSQIIDRRLNSKNKSAVNRQRFIRRYKKQIKQAVSDIIAKRSITEIEKGETITIHKSEVDEPTFSHGKGGVRNRVFPGNKEFSTGDEIQKPQQGDGQGSGNQASNQGEGTDEFAFQLSRQEFLDLYFEDLELPDLVRKQIKNIVDFKLVRSGFTADGVPTNINVVRSMRQAIGRRLALRAPYKHQLQAVEAELELLLEQTPTKPQEIEELQEKISNLQRRIAAVPFIDNIDLRYNNRIKQLRPATQAVMFCIMDVSGSMDENKKDIAKRFFILLYLFLTRNYEKIELVFIRHHTSAKEVDEQQFFYSRETGGTVVSSALELMRSIIQERYPQSQWNIYAAQASDGDNWNADSPYCQEILANDIMPCMQYFSYIEIMPRHHQSLWEAYTGVKARFPNFSMQNINNLNDIYPVFRELFKRQSA